MFSETRYALNGDLRVAYRASREGPRDILVVPNWFTMLDDLGSREAVLVVFGGAVSPAALFAATYPSRTTALVALDAFVDQMAERTDGLTTKGIYDASVALWGSGELQRWLNPDMPWNEEIRATWARHERLSASPATVAGMLPLLSELDVRAVLPTVRVPTLVVHHTNDVLTPPAAGKYIANRIPEARYVELPGRNMYHFVTVASVVSGDPRVPHRTTARRGR